MRNWIRTAAVLALLAAGVLLTTGTATAAGTGQNGFAATVFASGFPNNGPNDVGPVGLAFDASNQLYVMDYYNGTLYKFGPSGGVAGAPGTVVGTPGYGHNNATGIAFSPSGRLYLAVQGWGRVDEISPVDGHYIHTVVNGPGCDTGLAADGATGDLFVTSPCNGPTWRLSNYESGVFGISTLPVGGIDGVTVGPDGSLYLAQFGTSVLRLLRTGPSTFGASQFLAGVPTSDGTAVAPSLDPANPYVFANANNGTVTKIDTTGGLPGVTTQIYSGGSRGDFSTVGPDGCLYITQTDSIVKITNADGTCSFIPTTALPTITLAPATQSDQIGDTATITATLTNVAHPAGTAVTFTVSGPNGPYSQTVTSDSSGVVTFSYAGANTGDDTVTATSHIGTLDVTSNTADVNWKLPPDSTPPAITPHVSGPLGDNDWYTGDTTVTWSVTDDQSPVISTSGCGETDLSGYTAGTTLTCTATSAGGTAHESVTIKIDPTPPVVTPTLSGTQGTNGWYTSPVTVTWAVSDDESGIALTCNPQTFSADTASATASCTARNGAGLQTSVTTDPFKIDQTAPTVTFSGNAGSYDVNESVSIVCTSHDDLSGVASDTCPTTSGPAWSFGLGDHTVSATATDGAGNQGRNSTTFTVGVTANGLCALVHLWVSNAGIANSLCVKLQNSAAARARGQSTAAENLLAAFRNEVAAQTGKALTAAQASTLAALSLHL